MSFVFFQIQISSQITLRSLYFVFKYLDDFIQFKITYALQYKIITLDVEELQGQENELVLLFTAKTINTEPFQAYMNIQSNGIPTLKNYDYKAADIFDDKILEINKEHLLSFQKYFILMKAQNGAVFQVDAYFTNQTKSIGCSEIKYQVVKKEDYDFYFVDLYQLDDYYFNYFIEISLRPFLGYATLYVNFNEQSIEVQKYSFYEKSEIGQQIRITKSDILEGKVTQIQCLFTQLSVYIAIYGEEFCTYQLEVFQQFHYKYPYFYYYYYDIFYKNKIQISKPNFRKIVKGNLENFLINFSEYKDFLVELNIKIISGNPDFIITNFTQRDYLDNYDLIEDFFSKQSHDESLFKFVIFYSETQQTNNTFRLLCKAQQTCNWQINVYLNQSKLIDEARVCVIYYIIEDLYLLEENTPHKSSINKDAFNYYKFIAQEKDRISKLQFILTPVTGQVTLFFSQTEPYPNSSNCIQFSSNNQINIVESTIKTLESDTYYVSVYGNTISKYTITIQVYRNQPVYK